jgi:hypothetical protein
MRRSKSGHYRYNGTASTDQVGQNIAGRMTGHFVRGRYPAEDAMPSTEPT